MILSYTHISSSSSYGFVTQQPMAAETDSVIKTLEEDIARNQRKFAMELEEVTYESSLLVIESYCS